MNTELTISIVLYKSNVEQLKQLLDCISTTSLTYRVYLIDNSPADKLRQELEKYLQNEKIVYTFTGKNLGYGAGHNIALNQVMNKSLYHLVLNPDIEFKEGVLEKMFAFMQSHKDVGQLLPKVHYKNGQLQKLCHLLPQPLNLVGRRFFENSRWAKKINNKYELYGFNYDYCLNVPNLSGCFMFLRCSSLKQSGLFDERYFMYLEDVDLCRRIHAISKTVFYPHVSIIHGFEKESYNNPRLLKHHIFSAVKYFNKWGWFFDRQRNNFNKKVLLQINQPNYPARSSKPHLLVFTNRLVVGGISNDIIPLAWYLRNEFDVLILYGNKHNDEVEADFLLKQYPGLHLKKINAFGKSFNPVNDLIAYFKIKKEIRAFEADIVHTHGAKSGLIGRLAAYKLSVPCIIHTFHGHHFHSYFNSTINLFLLKLEKTLGRITSAVIAVSEWQKKELTEIYKIVSVEKVKTISLGIEPEKIGTNPIMQRVGFRKKYSIEDDVIAIGIAGRIVPVKNLELFVEVAGILLSTATKKLCFFIIGDGLIKKQIKEHCTSLNISYTENAGEKADVVFTSWIEDIIPAMHAMDIVALTSNNEGTPMSLIEAQFCAKPVVATNAGGVKDTLLNNVTGFLVERGNAAAINEKLMLLIENDELRTEMGEKAAIFAAEKFSKEKEVESYRRLYKTLLMQKGMACSSRQQVAIN